MYQSNIMKKKKTEGMTNENVKARLQQIISLFAGTKSDSFVLCKRTGITDAELFNLLESSIHIQQEELTRLRKSLRASLKNLDEIRQWRLL